jgi:hypothetical protein
MSTFDLKAESVALKVVDLPEGMINHPESMVSRPEGIVGYLQLPSVALSCP